jgi:hypothetical protein
MVSAVRRTAVAVLVGIAVLAACGVGLWALWRAAQSHSVDEVCRVRDYSLDPGQASIASTMVGVVISEHLPERAAVLALAAGLQESKLTNVPPGEGDRDSVGVLQQRPSQDWGTVAQLRDVHYATRAFLARLIKIDNWQTMQLADAVQAVQISADGSAYARHEGEAQALSDALTGREPAGITCTFPKPTRVAAASRVAALIGKDLPVNKPVAVEPTVRVPGASWTTAAWFVANADRLGIDSVAYSGRAWTRDHGWRADKAASPTAVIATMHR